MSLCRRGLSVVSLNTDRRGAGIISAVLCRQSVEAHGKTPYKLLATRARLLEARTADVHPICYQSPTNTLHISYLPGVFQANGVISGFPASWSPRTHHTVQASQGLILTHALPQPFTCGASCPYVRPFAASHLTRCNFACFCPRTKKACPTQP